jgi:outer membrane protein OmpA-like peptidoglycan-associated protein
MFFPKIASCLACTLLWGGLLLPQTKAQAPAPAQISAEQILEALAPRTRSLSGSSLSAPDRTYVEGLRERTRSLSVEDRDRVAKIVKDRPSQDLEIYFEYNSAAITAKAEPQLNELGLALRNARLQDATMLLSGHTDARGSDEFNQKLSEQRAEAVRTYLVEKFRIPKENLSTAGYGKRQLKNASDPSAAENRRVQIVNLGTTTAKQ